MSGYRRVNYYELCRLCTSSDGNKINIFRDDGRRRQLQTKIQTYLPIQVLEEDSLPKIVCHDCIKKLENYIEFRETVVSAETMLESYFTSLRFSEDFLKEGKVYVKSTEKERSASSPQTDLLKIEKSETVPHDQIVSEPQPQHQPPVVVSNINTSNIQIISGVQARVQQYKCAMQMQSGGVAAAVVEATAETHYSYQQQTSQQLSPQHHQSHGQDRINEHQNQSQTTQQILPQNQIHTQNQINQQLQSQRQQTVVTQQSSQRPQLSQQQSRQQQVTQQHSQPQSQYHLTQHIQQFREFEKQRQLQQIDKSVHISQQQQQHQQQQEEDEEEDGTEEEHQSQNQLQVIHQNNNVLVKDVNAEQSQVILKSEVESHNINSPGENVQNYTTVQATPEVFLSLGFKEATALAVSAQTHRDETKDFRDYIKNSAETSDPLARNSIGQISEFLRIRTCPESLITVNPQVICQPPRNSMCRDCGKTFELASQLNNHQCPNSPLISEVIDIDVKEEPIQTNGNGGGTFSCDICGKPFKRKEHLFQHRKLHTGERPYVCTTCTKAFSRKEHLVRHSVSHTGQKMHECELCGKSFSRKDNLHKHRKTHGVSGPYICETCGKSFVVKHYYLMHLTTHAATVIDGDNCQDPLPYKCDLCHKAFSVKQYLTTHKLRHRSKNNSHGNVQQDQHHSQQQQQPVQSQTQQIQQADSNNVTNGINVTSTNDLPATNGQRIDAPIVEIQNIIEANDSHQTQQQHGAFGNNQFHGNGQQFQ